MVNGPLEGPGNNAGDTPRTAPQDTTESNREPPRNGSRQRRRDRGSRITQSDFRAAFGAAQLAMAIVDRDGRVVTANRALGTLLGTSPESLTSATVSDLTGLGGDDPMRRRYHETLLGRGGRMTCTRRLKHTDGHTLWAEVTVTPTEREGEALLAVTDISEHRDLQERLRHLEMHDPVTKLPNRTLFFERLATALAETATGRIGVCYLDLDGFKAVNDTHGHRVGDELLNAVAQRLRLCSQDHEHSGDGGGQGHLVARLGGDEFVILVENSTGTEQLSGLAQAVTLALQPPFELAGQRMAVSASVGVVEREAEGTTPTELMQAADTTLYWAKADGRARWTLFDPERNAHRMTRQALSSALRGAVERGEFLLEYQPIVGFDDDGLRGVEALVRWQHPQFGVLPPNRFVGLAEENGAIVPLGRWVLEESCRQARRWMRERPDVPLFVSVNVAVRQVWDADLVADVARVLEETGLPADRLQLELTESAVMGSAGRPLQALQALSGMGVRIAIDDFGTGYSNLAYLSRLPVRVLKLDGMFVRGFRAARHQNPADETIVTALVQLAHQLGLTVTAECVEGPAQAERLRRIGCDTGQGWHYAKPMAARRVSALLAVQPAPPEHPAPPGPEAP
nr:EAL domain-containing protein [Streptomyces sp. HNM0574]